MSSSEQDTAAAPEAAPADSAERMADAAARDYDITAGEERLVRRPMPTLDVVHDRFARNLRSDWPAVIITGYADAEDIADRPAGVPLLGKPFRDKDLLDSIFLAIANAEPQKIEVG